MSEPRMTTEELLELARKAQEKWEAMPLEEKQKTELISMRNYLLAEAAFGDDDDEYAFTVAFFKNDTEELTRLDREAKERIAHTEKWCDENLT